MKDLEGKISEVERNLAVASHTWRVNLVEKGLSGAFTGMSAYIFAPVEKKAAFKRLMLAGGGQVLSEE